MHAFAGKVAGAKWEGSKTTFGDGASHNDGKVPDIVTQLVGEEDAKQCNHPTGASASGQQLPKMKWKKMAMAELLKVSCQILHVSSVTVSFMSVHCSS